MSKVKNNEYDAADIIDIISKNLNKKGRIKGKTKKETKALIAMCVHHKKNKNGKVKATTERVNGRKFIHCTMCNKTINGQLASDEEVAEIMKRPLAMIEQMKFMAASMGADKETMRFVTTLSSLNARAPKVYRDMRKIVEKKSHLKNKKTNRNQNASFGGWRNNA